MDIPGSTNRLLRVVLSWDYFELSQVVENGTARKLSPVPDTFESVQHYKSIFEPLVLEECCSGIVRGSVEGETPECHEAVIAARRSHGEWLFVRITLHLGISSEFKKGDLIILSRDHPDNARARSVFHALGIVESREGEQSIGVRFYLNLGAQAGIAAQEKRIQSMDHAIVQDSSWWLCSLGSLSTILREWVAVQHVHCLPFKDILLNATPRAKKLDKPLDLAKAMEEKIQEQYNQSQVDALHAGLDGSPLVLIQGPPGTGKTHAILGLLSIILHASHKGGSDFVEDSDMETELTPDACARLWAKQAPWIVGQPCKRDEVVPAWDSDASDVNDDCYGLLDYDDPIVIGQQPQKMARVLVCAPSNSALDEIVYRIITLGLTSNNGAVYHPAVVRVGVHIHHSVQSVSVDALIDQKIAQTGSHVSNLSERVKIEVGLLEEADIVATTLGFSGSTTFQRLNCKFDVVVIDEAAQAVEPSTLIPLMNGAKQVYLVGDPNQLPATVLSARASEYNYSKSLFKRLMTAGYPIHMMNVQYRMHPAISAFPSKEFYGGKLTDAPGVLEETSCAWHQHRCFGPFAFYHVVGSETIPDKTTSIRNQAEAEFVVHLYREMIAHYPELKNQPRVAVITPYSAQVKLIQHMLSDAFGPQVATMVDVNSIDGFQGRQREITFYSTVRSTERRKIGFVADEHRLNVGLTRARCSLIIVGNAKSLARDVRWARLILTAKIRNCFYHAFKPFGAYVAALGKQEIAPLASHPEDVESLHKLSDADVDLTTLNLNLPQSTPQERTFTIGRRGRRGHRGRRPRRGRH